jgi:hypothetical protein
MVSSADPAGASSRRHITLRFSHTEVREPELVRRQRIPTDKSPRAAARRKLRILACTERTTTVAIARTAVCDVILSRATLISRAFESA